MAAVSGQELAAGSPLRQSATLKKCFSLSDTVRVMPWHLALNDAVLCGVWQRSTMLVSNH